MKQIIVKLRDNTEIEMQEDYAYASTFKDALNDTRDKFVLIGEYVFAKDIIESVSVEEIKETEE